MRLARLEAVLVGSPAPLGAGGSDRPLSAIGKHPIERAWAGRNGFVGDVQADSRVHGGPEKALHHYPREHFAAWRAEIGPRDVLDHAGAFGENLSTTGLGEADVCIGDRVRCGGALLELAQARQPCWKLGLRFDCPDMAERVQASGRTGWYWRVLEEGWIAPGDAFDLLERPAPEWTVARLVEALYSRPLDLDLIAAAAELAPLAAGHRKLFSRRLAEGLVEDWSARLRG